MKDRRFYKQNVREKKIEAMQKKIEAKPEHRAVTVDRTVSIA